MKRVLLVDDSENFRRSLSIGLEDMGYTVYEANNGMEALQFLKERQVGGDIIGNVIVDARMPGLDGFLLYDQISAMDPSVNVVILSAHSYPRQESKYNILTKPIAINDLIEVMEQNVFVNHG
ncbi:response regulator [bacterium]|nr:response regulator [bacterium]